MQWLSGLQWPVDQHRRHRTQPLRSLGFSPISWLSRGCCRQYVSGEKTELWISRSTIHGQSFPTTVLQLVMEFRERIRSLEVQLGTDLMMAMEVPGLSLGSLGVSVPLLVLDARPKLRGVQEWLPHHLLLCRRFSSGVAPLFSLVGSV